MFITVALGALVSMQAALSEPPAQYFGTLNNHLSTRDDATIRGTGTIEDVQLCIADAIIELGVPSVLQAGLHEVLMVTYRPGSAISASVRLTQIDTNVLRAMVRVRGRDSDARIIRRIRYCLNAR